MYPYDFELYITNRLDGKNIFVDWKVKNPSEETIYFTIGAHPAFMFEGAKETKDDYLLWFSKMETLECCGLNLECGTGLPEESYSLELEDGYLQLSEKLFEVDTLICDDYQLKEVWLCKKDGRKPYVGVKSEGFYSYGIWYPFSNISPGCTALIPFFSEISLSNPVSSQRPANGSRHTNGAFFGDQIP